MNTIQDLLLCAQKQQKLAIAKIISFIENQQPGYDNLLASLSGCEKTLVVGITGPPGAGKSTLISELIDLVVQDEKKVAVLCVDPSSAFHHGAILGDRIRMSQWYNHPSVYIRSLASRGHLGGLHPMIIEVTDFLKSCCFDLIIIETVGVGQSEVEICSLATTTVVVLVPESGDEIQMMKAGLMEIADVFVVNKSDRPSADMFIKNLHYALMENEQTKNSSIPIIKTIASQKIGVDELWQVLQKNKQSEEFNNKELSCMATKLYQLIQKSRMADVHYEDLEKIIKEQKNPNIYSLLKQYSYGKT
ncbi:MAG: methylmalonyl Co-A mutase-associated GTPase MeaB [Phycisphaerales bacterium]|nr:methylmalonyl Co-A mutase-associated GTPase MeaB [Phycisphaerales bacterium]